MALSVAVPSYYNGVSDSEEKATGLLQQIDNGKEKLNMVIKSVPEIDIRELKIQEMQSEMLELENIKDRKEWYLAYKYIVYKYIKWIAPPETIYDYFTEDEVRLICQAVETECYQQDFESKCNVASTILNRYESGKFGETITDIITTENQFRYGKKSLTEDTILAVMYVWEIQETTEGALYFHSNKKTDTFNKEPYMFTDSSGHHFFGHRKENNEKR